MYPVNAETMHCDDVVCPLDMMSGHALLTSCRQDLLRLVRLTHHDYNAGICIRHDASRLEP